MDYLVGVGTHLKGSTRKRAIQQVLTVELGLGRNGLHLGQQLTDHALQSLAI